MKRHRGIEPVRKLLHQTEPIVRLEWADGSFTIKKISSEEWRRLNQLVLNERKNETGVAEGAASTAETQEATTGTTTETP